MADVALTVHNTGQAAGINVTTQDVTATTGNTYYMPNDGRTVLLVASTPGGTITFTTPRTGPFGTAVADYAPAIPAASQLVLGPFPPNDFNDGQGRLAFVVSANMDVLAVRI